MSNKVEATFHPNTGPSFHVYIAGPMRGIPAFNFPAFDAAAVRLDNLGHIPFSPADRDRVHGFHPEGMTGHEDLREHGFDLREALAADTRFIAKYAQAVAVLPGWEDSAGAQAEVALAHALGLIVAPVEAFNADGVDAKHLILPTRRPSGTVLEEV